MRGTILVTGASSGIGLATAQHFAQKGWQVVASMRNPETFENQFPDSVYPLEMDVSDVESIRECIGKALEKFGRIDVLVNNAGYGGFGAFELSTDNQRRQMYDVNLFGLMNVTQELMTHFRSNRSGLIINVSSIGGLMTYPLYSVYHSTKWAVEGFTESLHYELRQVGVRVKLIEPGVTRTPFVDKGQVMFRNPGIRDYDEYMDRLYPKVHQHMARALPAEKVAERIFEAATDGRDRLRYPVGTSQSKTILLLRRLLPQWLFFRLIRNRIEK
jgi:short-subunit dehydrogenase